MLRKDNWGNVYTGRRVYHINNDMVVILKELL